MITTLMIVCVLSAALSLSLMIAGHADKAFGEQVLNTLSSVKHLDSALAVIAAIAIILGIYFVIMLLYFKVRSKKPYSKWAVEVAFIGAALVASIIIKFVAYYQAAGFENNFDARFVAFLEAMYGGIGGLTFEGVGEAEGMLLASLLYGSSVLTALLFVSIISTSASYEFYSMLKLLGSERHKDIFVFTALNEESLTLANSIKEEYQQNANKHYFKPLIVFAGPELEPFDKKNELCVDAMAAGFLYYSYSNSNGKSIAKKLRINNHNAIHERAPRSEKAGVRQRIADAISAFKLYLKAYVFKKKLTEEECQRDPRTFATLLNNTLDKLYIKMKSFSITHVKQVFKDGTLQRKRKKTDFDPETNVKRFVVLAFAEESSVITDEATGSVRVAKNNVTKEEANQSAVYDDIGVRLMLDDKRNFKDDGLRIEYYILTKRDINYQVYNVRNEEFVNRLAEKLETNIHILAAGDAKKAKMAKYAKKIYQRHVGVNLFEPAPVIARFAALKSLDQKPNGNADLGNYGRNLLIWSLGFGSVGQAIAKELYVQSAYLNADREAQQVRVEVFDANARNASGLFAYTHPLFVCVGKEDVKPLPEDVKKSQLEYVTNLPSGYSKERRIRCLERLERNAEITLAVEAAKKKIMDVYLSSLKRNSDFMEGGKLKEDVVAAAKREMSFPAFVFNNVSCTDASFCEELDAATGARLNEAIADSMYGAVATPKEGKEHSAEMNSIGKPTEAKEVGASGEIDAVRLMRDAANYMSPDIMVIATGDDFRNIQIANAVIQDISCELGHTNEQTQRFVRKQVIIVNIWDERNNGLLKVSEDPNGNGYCMLSKAMDGSITFESLKNNLKIVIVGNRKDVFNYDEVLEYKKEAVFNEMYNKLYGALDEGRMYAQNDLYKSMNAVIVKHGDDETAIGNGEKLNGWISCISVQILNTLRGVNTQNTKDLIGFLNLDTKTEQDLEAAVDSFMKLIELDHLQENIGGDENILEVIFKCFKSEHIESSWAGLDMWSKESNRSASIFAGHLGAVKEAYQNFKSPNEWKYSAESKDNKIPKHLRMAHLANIEHQRWVRAHISDGWTYNPVKDKIYKQHCDLIPVAAMDLAKMDALNDMINVILAILQDDSDPEL